MTYVGENTSFLATVKKIFEKKGVAACHKIQDVILTFWQESAVLGPVLWNLKKLLFGQNTFGPYLIDGYKPNFCPTKP